MIGAIVGALASIGGQVANGIITSNANRKMQKMRNKYFKDATDDENRWYDREYNTVATDRADAQAASTRMAEAIKERQRARAGANAVVGGTEEQMQAAQAADAKAMADMQAEYAVANEARKDQISQQHRERINSLREAKINADLGTQQAKAQNVAQTTQGVLNAASQLASDLDNTMTPSTRGTTGDLTTSTVSGEQLAPTMIKSQANIQNGVQAQLNAWKQQNGNGNFKLGTA